MRHSCMLPYRSDKVRVRNVPCDSWSGRELGKRLPVRSELFFTDAEFVNRRAVFEMSAV
jgi:hypothetical protein